MCMLLKSAVLGPVYQSGFYICSGTKMLTESSSHYINKTLAVFFFNIKPLRMSGEASISVKLLNPSRPNPRRREKFFIKLNFYFHTSLRPS